MALGAFFNVKGLFAIVTGMAGLAVLHIGHFQLAFLHTEKLGLGMAFRALGSGMSFSIEDDLSFGFFVVFNFLPRAHSHSAADHAEYKTYGNRNNKKSFHKFPLPT
jgi:hypothetical protein